MSREDKVRKIYAQEGFTGYIHPDVESYFKEKYSQASFKVVPLHWPPMESKEDVDIWIDTMEKIIKANTDWR